MKKIILVMTAFAAAFSFVSCEKEPEITATNGPTVLYASTESGLTKTALSGSDAEGYEVVWGEGDEIVITNKNTGKPYTFTLKSGAGTTSGMFECSETLTIGQYEVRYGFSFLKLPEIQTYTPGKMTHVPMSATFDYTGGELPHIQFKNLCGLLRLTVKGSESAKVETISISSDYDLSGIIRSVDDATITFNGSKTVTLDCGAKGVALSPEGTDFYIALPECIYNNGAYSNVKIEVMDIHGLICTKSLKSDKNLKIKRSEITPASFTVEFKDELPGVFYVSDNLKVHFSFGNLYYDGTEFKFEDNQYDFRTYEGNVACIDGIISENGTPSGHWGLFGWSSNKTNYGMSTSTNDDDYLGELVEWGSAIGNGTYWHTLRKADWDYILNRYANKWISVCGINGYAIAPDGFGEIADQYDTRREWMIAQKAGLVFLPAAGYRHGTSVDYCNSIGSYWIATRDPNFAEYPYYFRFHKQDHEIDYRHIEPGFSVRLASRKTNK